MFRYASPLFLKNLLKTVIYFMLLALWQFFCYPLFCNYVIDFLSYTPVFATNNILSFEVTKNLWKKFSWFFILTYNE